MATDLPTIGQSPSNMLCDRNLPHLEQSLPPYRGSLDRPELDSIPLAGKPPDTPVCQPLGLLCAIYTHARAIKGLHFICFMDSTHLEMIMRKGCDKRCRKTSTLIKAIFVTLVHLNAVPSFVVCRTPFSPKAQTIPIPDLVFKWIHLMGHSPDTAVTQALINNNVISPL